MRLRAKAWLGHLDDARVLALAGDPEGVHQVRVSARRLRVWLSFKGHEALQEELRWVGHALALSRDLEVFGEVLTEEARETLRARALETTAEALDSSRWEELRKALERVRSPKKSKAKRALPKLERKVKKRRAELALGDGRALHRLRRTLRQVRYAREWLGLKSEALAQEQEQLGAVCDLLALEAFAKALKVQVPAPLTHAIAQSFSLLRLEPLSVLTKQSRGRRA